MGQFHLDADSYLAMIRSEIDGYDALQAQLADATADRAARRILDLGSGTGETAAATLVRHPSATLTGIDSSGEMLSIARQRLPEATFLVSRLEDPLPEGRFDVVVSAFAVHHLDGEQKALLFRRVAQALTPGGRFAMLDVVIPTETVETPIHLEEGVDRPSTVAAMLQWLAESGLSARVVHSAGDLTILTATAPG
jgi:tRNA (cmo5U34)-methyltransferase